ncbi:inorganic phosphate transporter PHO84 [Aspergillus terreus NIH2624]|uniref:Inorganic phosphate transporter PHO84 n=1 Tax=Aspergillus terreus (strain NIH 2624 / FGSC A1156) TaxID=341663 RepID=Q0CBJ6_ASPTN|nr:inorganic phosphate transporter PHO84 [Aspergillus terreus NIH2624]EAU31070.1 inorganic phosphate transporter PHO84 [Aspergillus terreus NIH2624]
MATQDSTTVAAWSDSHEAATMEDARERRRRALAEIDNAKFGWHHVRAVIVAGVGFFTDSYDIFAINLASSMLGVVFWQHAKGKIPSTADTAIKVSTSGGTVIGQLFFGWLADRIGRKRMYGIELMIIIMATLAQALSSDSRAISIVGILIFWRVIMGIGIGGDYPLSSIITSEFATTKWRGAMMGSVFAMQGFGQFGAAIIALIVTAGFKESLETASSVGNCSGVCQLAVDKMWRVVIGFGAVPACIALYYRLTIPETPRYTFDVARDIVKADEDVRAYIAGKHEGHPDEMRRQHVLQSHTGDRPKASWADFWRHYSQWKNGKVLLGTAGSWFFLDVAFYGLGLNNSIILSAIGWSGGKNVYEVFYKNAVGNLILICAGAIPGYWVTVATVDTIGRKPIQLAGFIILTILFIIIGFAYEPLKNSNNGLLGLYVIAQFFFNFGPNATTFMVPGECFPTRYRSTSHGMSAASGKVGAIIAQCVFGPLVHKGSKDSSKSPWLNHVMQIFALFMLCGCFTTLLIPETKRKTLEELSGEESDADTLVTPSPMIMAKQESPV